MEMTQVHEFHVKTRKLVMILHLSPFMDLTAEQRDREDRFFVQMYHKGYYARTVHGPSCDTVGMYKVD